MLNLLAQSSEYLGYGIRAISSEGLLDWIGVIVKWLIEGIGIMGVGIIVFTIILKTIVLPLDIFSRIKTKKQSLVMEQMRPQMEKLQKQYANDEKMYNQKVLELQKKSGASMLGACLPMIVSLLIFIFVFNSFSAYTRYANIESYNGMVKEYNNVVITYVLNEQNTAGDKSVLGSPDGFLIPYNDRDEEIALTAQSKIDEVSADIYDYKVDFDQFAAKYAAENAGVTAENAFTSLLDKYLAEDKNKGILVADGAENTSEEIRLTLVGYYMEGPAAQAVADHYEEYDNGFLWVGNIWYPDSTLNKEVPDFNTFKSTVRINEVDASYEESYNKVTSALTEQKDHFNGYYVLIVLSIGLMLLQQFISMRQNKSTNELSTVDGSGAKTNKMMMIMMPIIYGFFAFMYSAAFSIYMITNTLYSIVTTLIINWAMNKWFDKKGSAVNMAKNKKAKKI